MRAIAAIFVLLLVLAGMTYSVAEEVVGGEPEARGFFERLWNFIAGLFSDDEDRSVGAVANATISILSDGEDDSGELVACTEEARVCGDGSVVVRSGPDCEFEECPEIDLEVNVCSKVSGGMDACLDVYEPVCADVSVVCVAAPCDPVKQTFSNGCYACMNDRVESYVDGTCGDTPVNVLPNESWCLENPERCDDWTVVVEPEPDLLPSDIVNLSSFPGFCSEESKGIDACLDIYEPVCAIVAILCVEEPCDAVSETFPNACTACKDWRVGFYTEGACGEAM